MFKAPGPLYLIAAGTLAAAAYVWWKNGQASGDGSGFDVTGLVDDMTSSVTNVFTSAPASVANANVQAFLMMIRIGEGTAGPQGYTTFFGGGQFSDLSKHPNVAHTAGGYTSTAAGAYQFLYSTWQQLQAQYSLPDFSPASQDIAAVGLIKQQGALADVLAGRIATAIGKCNRIWASLAGSPYGQPTLTMADDLANYVSNGGTLTDGTVTA